MFSKLKPNDRLADGSLWKDPFSSKLAVYQFRIINDEPETILALKSLQVNKTHYFRCCKFSVHLACGKTPKISQTPADARQHMLIRNDIEAKIYEVWITHLGSIRKSSGSNVLESI
jgi:hypothetical protein